MVIPSPDWLATTRRLLTEARDQRSDKALRRAAIRIDGDQFKALPDDVQEELLAMYGQAMAASGALSP